jgi:hypothetical protein
MYLPTDLPMTEPHLLSTKIEELKRWQAKAWRRIADPQITPFERRKLLDHIKESDSALRHCLTRMYERNIPPE